MDNTNKTLKNIFVILVVIALVLGSFAGGFVTGHLVPFVGLPGIPGLQNPIASAPPTTSPEQLAATPAEFQALFSPFWKPGHSSTRIL